MRSENPYASPEPVEEVPVMEELPGPQVSLVGTARGLTWIAAGIAMFPVGMIAWRLAFRDGLPIYGGLLAACVLHAVGLAYCGRASKNLVRGGRALVLASSILMAIGVGLYLWAIPMLWHFKNVVLPYGYPALALGGLLWQVYLIRLATTLRCGRRHAWAVLLTFLVAWAAIYLQEFASQSRMGNTTWQISSLGDALAPYSRAVEMVAMLLPTGFVMVYLLLLIRLHERLKKLIRQPVEDKEGENA